MIAWAGNFWNHIQSFGLLICSAAFLTIAAFVLLPAFSSSQPNAIAEFEPDRYDFGDVRQNETLTHDFQFHNTSATPIEIAGHHTTCKCTKVPDGVLGKVLAPRAAMQIPLSISTGASTDHVFGVASFFVRPVGRKDAVTVVQTTLSAKVRPEYHLIPSLLDFGDVSAECGAVKTVAFVPLADPDAKIVSVRSSHPELDVELQESKPGAQCVAVKVRSREGFKRSHVSGLVWVETNNSRIPTQQFSVEAKVIPHLIIEPEDIVVMSGDESTNTTLTITAKSPFLIESVRCDDQDVSIKCDIAKQAAIHNVAVQCLPRRVTSSVITLVIGWANNGAATTHSPQTVSVPLRVISLNGDSS